MSDDSTALSRRDFLKLAAAGAGALAFGGAALSGCSRSVPKLPGMSGRRALVLGFDGLDPGMVRELIGRGHLPNMAKLAKMGGFSRLRSSSPPQSPVAWSNFITGMDPGGHAIFDFIHRDPKSYGPYLPTPSTEASARIIRLGDFEVPLAGGRGTPTRNGRAPWHGREEHGVPATIYRIPSNFPPEPSGQRTISDLGVPDLQGSYGHFSFFTEEAADTYGEDISGGSVYHVSVDGGVAAGEIAGPENAFRASVDFAKVPFTVYVDSTNPVARVDVGGERILLREGEWSDWTRVTFSLITGLASTTGIVRFYLKSAKPLRLYVSPVNIDPENPALPISTPDDYAAELARATGAYYTQGMAEDTKALSQGIFDDEDFISQGWLIQAEREAAFDYELDRYEDGLLFAYFSASDLPVHMFYRAIDPKNPLWTPRLAERRGGAIKSIYSRLDAVLGRAMERMGDDALIMVVSDHGFSPYRRSFDVNRWLVENGYLSVDGGDGPALNRADWARSKAYGMGFNGLYINEVGREAEGSVSPGPAKDKLVEEIRARLAEARDTRTGEKVFMQVRQAADYLDRPPRDVAPDLILGYARGYRGSWESAIGEMAADVSSDNVDKWSGDHCMDQNAVPGTLICNREIRSDDPALIDMAPTLLSYFDITPPMEMKGEAVLKNA